MVTGIERWKEYFSEYKDKYVLIGGAACNLLEEELDMNPRATKDLDLILVVEALTPDFGLRLWDFIKSANYADRYKGENKFKHEYYRFKNPEDKSPSVTEGEYSFRYWQNDETTSIDDIIFQNGILVEASDVYGIDGTVVRRNVQNLSNLSKGVYIVNGKKFVVK